MNERKKYRNTNFEIKDIKDKGICLLVHLSDDYGFPEIKGYSADDGIYLEKISKLKSVRKHNR